MRRQPILRKIIPVDCPVPEDLQAMLVDFRDMVNRLISWGLFERVRDPPEMRDRNYEWFREKYGGRYAAHYLHSACSVASDLLSSWDEIGGNTSSRPYVKKPFARLDQELVKVERRDREGVRIRVTLAPRHYAYVESPVNHWFWNEYLGDGLGDPQAIQGPSVPGTPVSTYAVGPPPDPQEIPGTVIPLPDDLGAPGFPALQYQAGIPQAEPQVVEHDAQVPRSTAVRRLRKILLALRASSNPCSSPILSALATGRGGRAAAASCLR